MTIKMRVKWVILLFPFALLACGDDGATEPEVVVEGISSLARIYLDAALDIMRAHSIKRYEIEWPALRQATFEMAGAAQTTSDTYNAIRYALAQLGDNHSFFRPPGGQELVAPVLPPHPGPEKAPLAKLLGEKVGYVSVSAFTGTSAEATALATSYHRMIEGVDTQGVCGWVVDLRGNTGGNMWPMVAGVGMLAGEGTLGFFVDPDSVVNEWTYQDGGSYLDGYLATQAVDPYELIASDPPVAVLTDDRTASSGEATTIAFRGRPDTRSFGQPTWGVSTANRGFKLSDGAMIYLTVSTMADRTGRLYGGKLNPDKEVQGTQTGLLYTDAPLAAGVTWILSQEVCAGG